MKTEDIKWILKEIDAKLARRHRPLRRPEGVYLDRIKKAIEENADVQLSDDAKDFLMKLYQRLTDAPRLKWGGAVRIPRW